jgi:hypothetical protein
MIVTTTIFFDTDWPRNFLNFFFKNRFLPIEINHFTSKNLGLSHKIGLIMIIAHISFQAIFPLRHFAYPGYVGWDEAGHNFSWHMKLRGKNGKVIFTVKDPDSKKTKEIDAQRYLTKRQIDKMSTRPYLLLQFAHFLRDYYTLPNEKPAQVFAQTRVSVNGRKSQRLIDPKVNLADIEPSEIPKDWVFPLRQPVWNATHKKNRFGPALKKDHIAIRAIPSLSPAVTNLANR